MSQPKDLGPLKSKVNHNIINNFLYSISYQPKNTNPMQERNLRKTPKQQVRKTNKTRTSEKTKASATYGYRKH